MNLGHPESYYYNAIHPLLTSLFFTNSALHLAKIFFQLSFQSPASEQILSDEDDTPCPLPPFLPSILTHFGIIFTLPHYRLRCRTAAEHQRAYESEILDRDSDLLFCGYTAKLCLPEADCSIIIWHLHFLDLRHHQSVKPDFICSITRCSRSDGVSQWVSQSVSVSTDWTDVTLVSDDIYWKLMWLWNW